MAHPLFQRSRDLLTKAASTSWAYFRSQPPLKLLFLAVFVPFVCVVSLFAFLFVGVLNGTYGPLPERSELARVVNAEASSIVTEDGQILAKYFQENRVSVKLEEISPYVVDGLIATEDARFFEHQGIDLRALGRVALRTVIMRDRSGGGGSTISQQLAKHLYPRQRYKSMSALKMKLREMVIASRLEEVYSKEELLRLYLNTVPYGENAYGIEVAANRFFNKPAADLKAEEAAVLVGLLKANTSYNPRAYPERSRERRNTVLALMARNESLTEAASDSLRQLPLVIDYQRQNDQVGSAPHFRQLLRGEVERALEGKTYPDGRPYDLDRDGLRIHISINSTLQRLAEEAVREQMPGIQESLTADWSGGRKTPWEAAFQTTLERSDHYRQLRGQGLSEAAVLAKLGEPRMMTIYDWRSAGPVDTLMRPIDSLRHYFTLLNAGLLATDPATGVVRAWVGGIDYNFVQYDHVRSSRQVGSTIKPVIYATALKQGMMPCEYTPAQQFSLADFNDYNPRNPNGEYDGAYSMRGGLAKSVNTVAVNIAVRTGLSTVVEQINDMGVTGRVEAIPSVALGTVEANLVEMNTVFSAFANRGRRPLGIHYLDKIEDAEGNVIANFPRPTATRKVMEAETAAISTYLMTGVVNSGTAARLRSTYGLRGPIAGKTGTTQDQSDGWFLGYTPKLVIGTWVGAEYPAVHFRTLRRGSATATALPIWGTFVRKLQQTEGLGFYRGGGFPVLDEMTTALLECPDYLEELPIYRDSSVIYAGGIADRLARYLPQEIEEMMGKKKRRNNETPAEYAERIAEQLEREERKDERRKDRKDFWNKVLFGKEN